MELPPGRLLFTIRETAELLSFHRMTVHRLINDGQLTRVYPRPRSPRITRDSLAALIERSADPAAMKATTTAQAQARAQVQAEAKQEKKKGFLARWGMNG